MRPVRLEGAQPSIARCVEACGMRRRACVAIGIGCLAALAPATAQSSTEVFTNARGDQLLTQRVLLQGTRPLYATTREPGSAFGPLAPVTESAGGFSVNALVDDAGGAAALITAADPSGNVAPVNMLATRAPGGSFRTTQETFPGSDLIFTGNARG